MMKTTTLSKLDLDRAIKALEAHPYKQGNYSSRNWGHDFHFLVSYMSKLKPSIAFHLIHLFTRPGDVVLDPFSGVGTIPFEACSQGRLGLGSDISPIAFNATMAKVNPPSISEAKSQMIELSHHIERSKRNVRMDIEEEIIPYYHPDTLNEILAAKQFFTENKNRNFSFLKACVLHILHGNRPYALSRRSHNIMPWPPKGDFIYKSLMKSLEEKVNRMLSSGLPLEFTKGNALNDNASQLTIGDLTIDCIVTSPPFHQNADFIRMNRIRLWFCGWDYRFQAQQKLAFLEHQKEIAVYNLIFKEFYRILRPGSLCILHLGVVNSFDMSNEIQPHAEKNGFIKIKTVYEDTSLLESHGIRDRGATQKHQFLILKKGS